MSEWISVKDRLPEKHILCLVTYHPCHWVQNTDFTKTLVGTDRLIGKNMWARNKYQNVTHWMPLPEPPEEENE